MSAESKAIGARLREAREADPYWSRSDLARRMRAAATPGELPRVAHVKSLTDMIKAWEAGKAVPSPRHPYRALYARVTGLSEAELFETAAPSLWRTDGLNDTFTADDEDRLAYVAKHPLRVDSAVLESLAVVLAAQRRLEDAIGSEHVIGTVRAQLATIEALVAGSRGELRTDVLDQAAQWAQFAAWLHAATRRLERADQLYDRAIVWATEADNADMIATAWNMKGHIAWLRHAPGAVIGLSQVAARERRASPGVRALAAQQEARGHAIAGDVDAMERRLDDAVELTGRAAEAHDDEPPWIYFFNPGTFMLQRARAYLYVPGRTERAAALLEEGFAAMPAETRASEWAAYYLADLGRAYRALHEDTEAERLADEVADIAARTGSDALAMAAVELR